MVKDKPIDIDIDIDMALEAMEQIHGTTGKPVPVTQFMAKYLKEHGYWSDEKFFIQKIITEQEDVPPEFAEILQKNEKDLLA